MKSWRNLALGLLSIPVAALLIAGGCTRKLAVAPTAAVVAGSPTNTGTSTNTFTWTFTPSPTPTFTNVGPSNTPTMTFTFTNTGTSTFTHTATASPTDTFTNGPTLTFTNTVPFTDTFTFTSTFTFTPTLTFTPTVPPDPNMIDNLEDGDAQIMTNGGRDGYWFTSGDAGCAAIIVPQAASFAPSMPGNGSTYATQFSGSGCNVTGALVGFNFKNTAAPTDPKIPYDVSGYSGVVFDIKQNSGQVSSVWFALSTINTEPTASGGACAVSCNGHFGQLVPMTGAYQSVTVWFSWMNQPNWAPATTLDLTQAFGMQWESKDTTGKAFDFSVDNIKFITGVAPPTPTPDCKPIDNMEDGDGQVNTVCGRDGYWYSFIDKDSNAWGASSAYSGNGANVGGAGQTFIMSSPGNASSAYCARLTGVVGAACGAPYNTCPFVGFGFDFYNVPNSGPGNPKHPYDISGFTGIRYYIKGGAAATSYRLNVGMLATTATADGGTCSTNCSDHWGIEKPGGLTASWQQVSFVANSIIGGGDLSQKGWGTTVTWDPTNVVGLQWQFNNDNSPGKNYDISVDDITFY